MKKRALVLSGGGTKGIYQAGAIEALKDLGLYDFDMIIGTSVGALNAMFLVQDEFDKMLDMYEHIDINKCTNERYLKIVEKFLNRIGNEVNKKDINRGFEIIKPCAKGLINDLIARRKNYEKPVVKTKKKKH